ncbi:hypothetical protein AGMMS49525_06740 [Bacteroidia bacterium]|nr:hypothetical protein AGMMS49525_06740 [Bacteroidia bacterium]
MNKKTIVVSAINLFEGGPLTILQDCLSEISKSYGSSYRIIALVHNKKLCEYPNVEYIEIPQSRRSWLHRIYFEYFYFRGLSKKFKPYLWLSLHDISPNVYAERKAVYCHNPTPFYKTQMKDLYYNYKYFLFSLFYKFLYGINIKKNWFVIVQQNWIRDAFSKMYQIEKSKIIVARPKMDTATIERIEPTNKNGTCRFVYPAFPRPFKNFEIIGEAARILFQKNAKNNFEIVLTIDGSENKYAGSIVNKYKDIEQIKFVGLLSKDQVQEYYQSSDCLIFPSKLETWGLPVSEFLVYKKPMLIADLEYAHETAAGASAVSFFDPNSAQQLAEQMQLIIDGDRSFFAPCPETEKKAPYASSWNEIFTLLLQ